MHSEQISVIRYGLNWRFVSSSKKWSISIVKENATFVRKKPMKAMMY